MIMNPFLQSSSTPSLFPTSTLFLFPVRIATTYVVNVWLFYVQGHIRGGLLPCNDEFIFQNTIRLQILVKVF